ncbi:MAG: carbohydrate binding family 9 domain-containing protein [Gemmatimonadaceae bacterium]|nr:carbohydrate binding family 9 domain-containing protein [Gemmatimonadaceae bacterium]
MPAAGAAQLPDATVAPPPIIRAASALRLDGRLDEAAWLTADSITDFTQRDPREGTSASERTVVRLLATEGGLYVGLRAFDREPGAIRRAQLRRDADLSTDDQFSVMIDALRDKRSGFIFSINPNAALVDSEILTFESENRDWDGIWDARARITADGWDAELFIPWQTLRYRDGAAEWGMNFRRFIRRKNEEVLWRAWRRPEGLRFLEREGTVATAGSLPARARIEARPYVAGTGNLATRTVLASGADSITRGGNALGDVGMDLKLAPTKSLTLDVTLNADFAQAEVDRQIVNLTRFPLFFPEQRPFFTEGAGIFDFGRIRQTQLFYSRRIGLGVDGSPIPLVGGARLTGRVGRQQVGLLAARTGGDDAATDLVARVKRDVLGRGFVGAMATWQDRAQGAPTPTVGADFNFPFIVRGQNLVLIGSAAAHRDSLDAPTRSYARLIIDYPNDNADLVARFDRVDDGFDPALGFVQQSGIWRYGGSLAITPRPRRWGIRRLLFNALNWNIVEDLDGRGNNASFEVQPFGAQFESDDRIEFTLQRAQDRPSEPFAIFPGTTIAAGGYQWQRAELELSGSPARLVVPSLSISRGGFYDGQSTELTASVRTRWEPHVLATAEFVRSAIARGGAGFTAQTVRLRTDVAASPRLNTTLFGQWDNQSRRVTLNARVRWTTSPGSDLYVVWNSAWLDQQAVGIRWARPQRGGLVVKYVRYVRA